MKPYYEKDGIVIRAVRDIIQLWTLKGSVNYQERPLLGFVLDNEERMFRNATLVQSQDTSNHQNISQGVCAGDLSIMLGLEMM
ncbi:hypothetical protein LCGC14_0378580 [marine sediment metagenome]|uniref:Uncharacterized protein n=1 Tax=marine sediment metagenome TaxID=412755 RepID=A0A0F9T2V3_9ZZZZ